MKILELGTLCRSTNSRTYPRKVLDIIVVGKQQQITISKALSTNLVTTLSEDMLDVFDVDEEGEKVDGSYGGLRSGEWSRVVAFLTSRGMRQWQQAMDTAIPPLTCGKMKVVDGIAGRGNNTSSFPTLGPFLG